MNMNDLLARQRMKYANHYLEEAKKSSDELSRKFSYDKYQEVHTFIQLCLHEINISLSLSNDISLINESHIYKEELKRMNHDTFKKTKKEKPQLTLYKQNMSNYIVLDLETTGLKKDSKIIEIGMLKVKDNRIVDQYSSLVNPKMKLSNKIVELTGITDEMLIHQPVIDEIKNEIAVFIGDDVILGHNVSFDLSFLLKIVDYKKTIYLDTLYYSQKAFTGIKNHKLSTLVKILHLNCNQHRALADCIATKDLYDAIINMTGGIENLYKENKYHGSPQINLKIVNDIIIDKKNLLYNCHYMITGIFEHMSEGTIQCIMKRYDAYEEKSVNKKLNVLIVGKNPSGKGKSVKLKKAEEKISHGQMIHIIYENDFYQLLDY